ncbi:MAG: biotin/lipoyl-binding protein, partial [Comamonadaceae bacterium]
MILASLTDALRNWRRAAEPAAAGGFFADAGRAALEQEPLRARLLLRIFWATLIVAVLWAGFTHVDEITRGEGRVIPSRQLQVLQSLDGGVVSEILVREGQVVEAGQVLVAIDPTRFDSSVQE